MGAAAATDLDVLRAALAWAAEGHRVVLVTVLSTWGSAPRRAGSHLVVRDDQHFVGSVSGGCVEGAVVLEAMQVLTTGCASTVEYGVADEDAWDVGLACGGRIRVLLTCLGALERDAIETCVDQVQQRVLVGLRLSLDGGLTCVPGTEVAMSSATRRGRGVRVEDDSGTVFLRPFSPSVRALVIGAVHIAAALRPILELLGHQVVIVDPRRGFSATQAALDAEVVRAWPDDLFEELGLDARTAVIALTHDPKIDDPGLEAALRSPALYIGALGSKKTHARRCTRLAGRGFNDRDLARIRGPIGLDIGAANPAEIALSIAGELTATLRGRA